MGTVSLTTQVYIRHHGQTLMMRRAPKGACDPMAGRYVAVGGRIEVGEMPEECARREVYEEAGITIGEIRLRGILIFVEEKVDARDTCYAFVFETDSFTGTPVSSSEGAIEWVKDEDILRRNILAKDRIFLPWIYKRRDFFSGRFYSVDNVVQSQRVIFYGETKRFHITLPRP